MARLLSGNDDNVLKAGSDPVAQTLRGGGQLERTSKSGRGVEILTAERGIDAPVLMGAFFCPGSANESDSNSGATLVF